MTGKSTSELDGAISIESEISRPDQQTLKMFSILFEHSETLFFIVSPDGNQFTFISRIAGDILGYSVEEIMHMSVKAIVSPATLTKLCNAIHRIAASGIAVNGIINLPPHFIELIKKDTTVWKGEIHCSLQMSIDHMITSISGVVLPLSDTNDNRSEIRSTDCCQNEHDTATTINQNTPRTVMHQGKILIMDDEDILIDIASQIGKRMGLIVECAKNGEHAIALYRKALEMGQPHDAVLLDMTIAGGKGGLDTSLELHAINPEVITIVMSGYSDHEVMAKPEKYGFKGVITKPFRLSEFGKVLRVLIPAEKFKTDR